MDRPSKSIQDSGSQTSPNEMAHAGSPPNLSSRMTLTPAAVAKPVSPAVVTTASPEIPKPSRREDFEVAIICALPLEYDAVSLLFDEFWDEGGDAYGRAVGDHNTYTTGRIDHHSVVLVLLPHMGKVHAAGAAASLRASYTGLRLALLAGICGGVPQAGKLEVLLGDVIISSDLIQYDFGRQYSDRFVRKDTIRDSLYGPVKDIRSLLAIFQTEHGREQLQQRTTAFLKQLQTNALQKKRRADYSYPGVAEDKLFEPSYRHKHRVSPTCVCRDCHGRLDPVCDEALDKSCKDLGCDERYLVLRDRIVVKPQLDEDSGDKQQPVIHVGSIASGDKVMKSGEDRDALATEMDIIAFEMEGAGVWEEIPCVVVKGVCDYADSHKNKRWQDFAAATAASASKAILERYAQTDKALRVEAPKPVCHWTVPFGRNEGFVGRQTILHQLLERIPPSANKDDCQRTAIEGLGGIGKTQLALEAAFRIRDEYPDCSVFWVPVIDITTFENAYRDIGRRFDIPGIDDDKVDVKVLVKNTLSCEDLGRWLLVIDNADDAELFFGATGLSDFLPFSKTGSILFTTRNHQIAMKLDIPERGILCVTEMSRAEAIELLRVNLKESQICDMDSTSELLEFLADLPLAIKQASAFMAQTGMTTTKYLRHCQSSDKTLIKLLSKDFEDRGRYKSLRNPIATTWLISFEHISRIPLAARYLRYISFLAEKDIPRSLLPIDTDELQADEAIGVLKAYAFITQRKDQDLFDVHRLVHLVMRAWLEESGEQQEYASEVMEYVAKTFPRPEHENRDVWMRYLPHAQALLNREGCPKEPELLCNIGHSFSHLGKYREAEQMYRQEFELNKGVLGREHRRTITSMYNLSWTLEALGQYNEAEQMGRQAFELYTKVYGREHPQTIISMNNLAWTLLSLGRHNEAEQIEQQAFELNTKVHGREHPETLVSMHHLAWILHSLGRNDKAEQIGRQAFELYIKVYGQGHLGTLANMCCFASILHDLGQYNKAEQMGRQAFELQARIYGQDHPKTITSMHNLARILQSMGRYNEAEQMGRQAFKLYTRVHGQEHPYTLISMSGFAQILQDSGQYNEAEQMGRQALELQQKVHGREHPDTVTSMSYFARILRELGQYNEAERMERQAFELHKKVHGQEHPYTLRSMSSFAQTLQELGRYDEAEQMGRQAFELCVKVHGQEHPKTITSMHNLACILRSLGRYNEAEQMGRQIFELRTKILGREHPHTLASMQNLAVVLDSQGKYEEAVTLMEKCVHSQTQVLGSGHPDTKSSLNTLEGWKERK